MGIFLCCPSIFIGSKVSFSIIISVLNLMFKLGVHLIGAHGNGQFKDVSNHMEEAKKIQIKQAFYIKSRNF